MTEIEYKNIIKELNNINYQLIGLKKEITDRYIKENTPFNIGDVIIISEFVNPYTQKTFNNRIGKITEIYCDNDDGFLKAKWKLMNKNGTFSNKETFVNNVNLMNAKIYNEQ